MQVKIEMPADMKNLIKKVALSCGVRAKEIIKYVTERVDGDLRNAESLVDDRKLTQDEFMTIPAAQWVSPFIDTPATLEQVASKIIDDYEGNFDNISEGNQDLAWCSWLQKHWDWEKVGRIETSAANGEIMGGDGNHRRVTLAVLLKTGQTEYRPITCHVISAAELTPELRDKHMRAETQRILTRDFKTIETVDTLLSMPCMLKPIRPDFLVGVRTMQNWIDGYQSTHPDNYNDTYFDMKSYLDTFNRLRVTFLTNYDMYYHQWQDSLKEQGREKRFLDRQKWIIALGILIMNGQEEWKPVLHIPDLFLDATN